MKIIFRILILLIAVSAGLKSNAQDHELCGHVEYLDLLKKQYPQFGEDYDASFRETLAMSQLKSKFEVKDTVYEIRVVFHIVHESNLENLEDTLIRSQIKVLNECFRRQNPDTTETRDIFKSVAGDVGIEFKLAELDPNGNPTNGITRTQTSVQNFTQGPYSGAISNGERVKQAQYGRAGWDPNRYLNVWVCDLGSSLYGYAFPPTGAPNWGSNSYVTGWRQGVVLNFRIVGEGNIFSSFTGAKTAVHEVGHFLGLRHIWGDAPGWDRCNAAYDDGLEDTPLAGLNSQSQNCPTSKNSCYTGQNDLPDMIENYMDYTQGFCQNMFTNQQIALMRTNLTTRRMGIYETFQPDPPAYANVAAGVHPNPASSELLVVLEEYDENAQYSLEIYSTLGQKVYEATLESSPWQRISGMYMLNGMHYYRLIENGEKIVKSAPLLFVD